MKEKGLELKNDKRVIGQNEKTKVCDPNPACFWFILQKHQAKERVDEAMVALYRLRIIRSLMKLIDLKMISVWEQRDRVMIPQL